MTKREKMRNLYEKADNIQPFAEKDGKLYVSFEDAAVLNSLDAEDGVGTGMQTRNADGSIASTGKRVHAVNPDYFFLNRYCKKGKKMHLVSGHTPTGYRCIREQSKGRTFVKSIPCYIFERNAEGEIVLDKVTTVSESEFISEFTKTLDHKSMAEILPLIASHGNEITADSMPI